MTSNTLLTPVRALAAAGVCMALTACAAPVQEESDVSSAQGALSRDECADQRDACYQQNPLFGLFTCPLQYNQCVASAEGGLPAQVAAAIDDAEACAAEALACRSDAGSPAGRLACTEEAAVCVASIVDANLPTVVSGTLECVDGAVSCINASETVGDLAGCAETLEECALDQAVSVLPPGVGDVVEDVTTCELELAACTLEAGTPSQLATCAEDNIQCVADGLGIVLPDPPVADALACAETATVCTLEARSLEDLGACGDGLISCTASLVEEELTCEQAWNACLWANPLNFFGCAAELAGCTD